MTMRLVVLMKIRRHSYLDSLVRSSSVDKEGIASFPQFADAFLRPGVHLHLLRGLHFLPPQVQARGVARRLSK